MNTLELSPRASVMIEAMRDIGYSFEAAIADIIDNSIAAASAVIDVRFGWTGDEAWIAVVDNGRGMTRAELLEALRPGSRSPRVARAKDDLGRFGLGLKTASFSQCRELVVFSRGEGPAACMAWDLDLVERTDQWKVTELGNESIRELPTHGFPGETGTVVIWRKIDRLDVGIPGSQGAAALNEMMDGVRSHISRIFHRFLAGEPSLRKIEIRLNNNLIEPFDPFHENSLATQKLPKETIHFDDGVVTVQPFILPHHSKVSARDYERLAGSEGYLRNQGFYIYRNRRLILWGNWFRLAKQEELTKLARVRIDIPNNLDQIWGIDIRKSRAHPPLAVRNRLRQVIEQIRGSAKRPYTHRGRVIIESALKPVWERRVHNDRIEYQVNLEHPAIGDLVGDLGTYERDRLRKILVMIGQAFPAAPFFSDYASTPRQVEPLAPAVAALVELASLMTGTTASMNDTELKSFLLETEPFARHADLVPEVVRRIRQECQGI